MLALRSGAIKPRIAPKIMIATTGLTMFVVFCAGAGIVTGYVLLVHRFLRNAR